MQSSLWFLSLKMPLSSQLQDNMVGLEYSISSIPNWIQILMEEKFFTPCSIHDSVKKNEKNIFCLDCCTSICPHCLPLHHPHLLLQVRRYMYSDVIRLGDAHKWLNCSLVQPYTTNRAKVVFLKQRPSCRPIRGSGNFCITCDRSLQDPYLFCSLSCKVNHLLLITKSATTKESSNNYEYPVAADKARSSERPQEIDDSQITPDSVLDSPTSLCTLSGSTSTSSASGATEFLKKKRSSVHLLARNRCKWRCTPAMEEAIWVNRRKCVPHRSPLY